MIRGELNRWAGGGCAAWLLVLLLLLAPGVTGCGAGDALGPLEVADGTGAAAASETGNGDEDTRVPLDPTEVHDARFGPTPEHVHGTQEVQDPFPGVRIVSRRAEEVPRRVSYHVVLIDPKEPGIVFAMTPPNGPDLPRDTTRQTTRAFVSEHELQLGINAHFFSPWPAVDDWADLLGLAIADGVAYAPFRPGWQQAFVVRADGTAGIVEHDGSEEVGYGMVPAMDPPWVGAGTNERILRAGEVEASWEELHPRTAIGVTAAGHVLFLIVDGRQPRLSEGMTTPELAEVLMEFGAVEAINMDGGGSTTLVLATDEPRLVNSPIGLLLPNTERPNGSNLGIRARRWEALDGELPSR